ncbi:MAG: fumarylacetoacetate hydrolase family protein [Planctomycetota bacterium]
MKIALFSGENDQKTGEECWSLIVEDRVLPWKATDSGGRPEPDDFSGLVEFLALENDPTDLFDPASSLVLSDVRLLAPVQSPEEILCIGKNYAAHAAEMGGEVPEKPVVFGMFASAVTGPGCDVEIPDLATQVDYEAELVAVIGKAGRNIPRSRALEHVFGYTCGNDITSRDWQKGQPGGQWLLGKSIDGFAPVGPWIVTADELDPDNTDVKLRLNGETMQSGNTGNLIFPVDYLIEHLSRFFTLRPGDLIFTGTPEGVGAGRTPPLFMKDGDVVEVEIPEIGILRNRITGSR